MRINKPVVGFLFGALLPVLGFFIVFAILGAGTSLSAFSDYIAHNHQELAKVISLSILINLVPFLLFTRRRLDAAARGILIATMLYFVAYVLLKFVW